MDTATQLRCTQCPAAFRRTEHLRRHLASHGDERPYRCDFCARSFNRSDVLKRHLRSCRFYVNTGVNIANALDSRKGRKPRACDRCARLKKACTFDYPCASCRTKRETCSYERLGSLEKATDRGISWIVDEQSSTQTSSKPFNLDDINPFSADLLLDNSEFSLIDWDIYNDPFQISPPSLSFSSTAGDRAGTLIFLSRITSVTGLSDSFECQHYWQKYHITDLVIPTVDDSRDGYSSCNTSLDNPNSSLVLMEWVGDNLLPKSLAIVELLKRNVSNISRYQQVAPCWSNLMESLCMQFFNPANIRRFLRFFWLLWYPHCPIVHKPTFQAEEASPVLLATMVVIGACVSPHAPDNESAKLWFDIVEETAFTHELSNEQYLDQSKKLECLQAIYFVCLIQTWEGSKEAKIRIRQSRFASVLMVARGFVITTATHEDLRFVENSEVWWRQFILKEQIIRTLIYVFLLDVAFAIFYNSPPRMIISELQMDLTCPEECFQTSSADACLSCFEKWIYAISWKGSRISLRYAVRRICEREMPPELQTIFSKMSTLNMFTIISALHILLFHMQSAIVIPDSHTLESGLANWKRLWEIQELLRKEKGNSCPMDLWRGVGFMRHAEEYWLLANILLERFRGSQNDETDADSAGLGRGNLDCAYDPGMHQLNMVIMEYRRSTLEVT